MKVLLTGATGFVGTTVARLLLEEDVKIVALVRAKNREEAERRLRRHWYDFPELQRSIGSKVEVLPGDVSLRQLGLKEEDYRELVSKLSYIINAAADIRLNASLDELRKTNSMGVENLLLLAKAVHQDHGLKRFSHISTAYVAGGIKGEVKEAALSESHGFLSNYERSKFEGELLVQKEREKIPISVFRPGMIVGDSKTGWIKTFNTLYYPLRLYMTRKARIIPVSRYQGVNLIPVDVVAQSIVRLTFDLKAEGETVHLTPPRSSQPTVKRLVDFVREWAKENLNVNLPRPIFLPLPTSILASSERESLKAIDNYLKDQRIFLTNRFEDLCGPYQANWRDFLPILLQFATSHAFMHRSERTVHEQVLFRLDSKRRPVRIFDVVDGKAKGRDAGEIKQEILACVSSLKSLGMEPGDRVSIVGLNSSRYLSLDIALGLVGVVSVPLYFTSPPKEIEQLVEDSGSKLLFIGSPMILKRCNELHSRVPIISFTRSGKEGVMSWEEFLAQGKETPALSSSPLDFDDLATIRYTSSTTGRPKGVTFNHRNLRWMAETIAAIPPWDARNSAISYLSFLPLNHVVEGILGTYSPYYAPAPISIYFLENFNELPKALALSRPTVFFSVPRFYERAWSQLEENSAGRRYLRMKDGILKSIYRSIVRRGFLKKSGLDRTKMLISGSAPIGDDLLLSYRDLGIEIHNAYGETEAPLVTINRLGRNRIGTVGEPLPETEVRIGEDAEILVNGPQVTQGYFGNEEAPFQDGWLLTGDYGRMEDGYLTILGRKKELIKTSYGKFVHPMKIESMLRDIPGVTEAMIIGEGRPFCAALLWINKENRGEASLARLEREIEKVNSRVSNPEKVKCYALLGQELSIERGDLTPNLKLKRRNICDRYSVLISDLYQLKKESPEALRLGGGLK